MIRLFLRCKFVHLLSIVLKLADWDFVRPADTKPENINRHIMKIITNRLTKLFILSLVFLSTSSLRIGSGTAILKGKSDSGKTSFIAHLQDIIGIMEGAKFTIENSTVEFDSDDNAGIVIDSKVGVLTLFIEGKGTKDYPNGRHVQFWAIPSTFKIIKEESGHKVYEFRAKIQGTEPRIGKGLQSSVTELNCSLEYEI